MQRSPRLFSALYPGLPLLLIISTELLRGRFPSDPLGGALVRALIGTAVLFGAIWALMPRPPFFWPQLIDPRSIRWWGVGFIIGGGLTYALASRDLRFIGGGIAGLGLCYLPSSWVVARWPAIQRG
ncbi:MAG: hypothetical protein ABJC19_11510 [Gemmatimonadota bacterium]